MEEKEEEDGNPPSPSIFSILLLVIVFDLPHPPWLLLPPCSPLSPPVDLGPHTEYHGLLEHLQHVTSEAHPLKALGRFPEQLIEIAGGVQKGDAPWGARPRPPNEFPLLRFGPPEAPD